MTGRRVGQCKDCEPGTSRPAPRPGPRCVTHDRAVKAARREAAWEKRLLETYNITAKQYWAIYEAQGERCYMCQRATGKGRKKLSVDHDHKTGMVRGILCGPCNRNVLGHARDEIGFFRRSIEYLTDPPAVRAIGRVHVPSGT